MAQLTNTQVRDGMAWATGADEKAIQPNDNPWTWFFEAIQGDFNENRSTAQILTDAAISMIPVVDQICDLRDLVANSKKLSKDPDDKWAWVSLALTLVGLLPVVGSLLKGVLKIFFSFVARCDGGNVAKAVQHGMSWVVTFLRRRDVQLYLRKKKIDEVFSWAVIQVRIVRNSLDVPKLIDALGKCVSVLERCVEKVAIIPKIGDFATAVLSDVKKVQMGAQEGLNTAHHNVVSVLDEIIQALERTHLHARFGILDVGNVHFRGGLPESVSITLMRTAAKMPRWLTVGNVLKWKEAKVSAYASMVSSAVKKGWPSLSEQNILSFHRIVQDEIKGPARLYRIISPNSRAMGDCWVSEDVFRKLQASPDPRTSWRKYLAVWPDWNVNGQFVIFDVKPGENLKVWRGPASSQAKKSHPDAHLEGGWEQIIFKIDRSDSRNDSVRYYKEDRLNDNKITSTLDQVQYDKLSQIDRVAYAPIRESINHGSISGPFETRWGYTDFEGKGFEVSVGVPPLPGQTTELR